MFLLWQLWRRNEFQQKCQGIWSWYFIWVFLLTPRWLWCFWCQFPNANYWPYMCPCFCLQVSEKIVKWLNPRTPPSDLTQKSLILQHVFFWCHFANANNWPNMCSCFCLQVSEKIVKWLNPRTAPCDLTEKTLIAIFLVSLRECKLLAKCAPVHLFIDGYWVFFQNQWKNCQMTNLHSVIWHEIVFCFQNWSKILWDKLFYILIKIFLSNCNV